MCTPNGTAFELIGLKGAPVMVLIHGLGLCRKLWRDHLEAFSQEYRVLNYDFFGHGESAPPPQTASLSVYACQLRDLMDELEIERAHLVGFSIGGMINRRFALDYPERLNALVILNSPHERDAEAQVQVEARAAKVADEGAMATMDAALERWFTPAFREAEPGKVAQVRDWRAAADQASYPDACMVLAAGVTELNRPKTPVMHPTLVMTCENDTGSTPAMSQAIAAEIPGAVVEIVPLLRHLGLMEKPEAFCAPVLSLLKNVN